MSARPPVYDQLTACLEIGADPERLACLETAAKSLKAAVDAREVIITSRADVARTKRSLFGLRLPDLGIFGGDEDREEEALSQIDSTIRTASFSQGGWTIMLEDGSIWRQQDTTPLAIEPSPAMPVTVRRGALGSYRMSIRKQPPIKVRRTI